MTEDDLDKILMAIVRGAIDLRAFRFKLLDIVHRAERAEMERDQLRGELGALQAQARACN